MLALRVFVLGCLIVSGPRAAEAHEILFELSGSFGFGLVFGFGLESFHTSGEISKIVLDGSQIEEIGGLVDIQSGPLLDLTVDSSTGATESIYTYAPGTIAMTAGTESQTGTYAGTLQTLTITVQEASEGCDVIGCLADVFGTLGPGLFDAGFLEILGISGPAVTGGTFSIDADLIDGDPSSRFRGGGSRTGFAEMTMTVPEPSVGTLSLMIGVFAAWRMRRRVSACGQRESNPS